MSAEQLALAVSLGLCSVSGLCAVLLYLVVLGSARLNESRVALEQRATSRKHGGAK